VKSSLRGFKRLPRASPWAGPGPGRWGLGTRHGPGSIFFPFFFWVFSVLHMFCMFFWVFRILHMYLFETLIFWQFSLFLCSNIRF
jgi:hypothetical protein